MILLSNAVSKKLSLKRGGWGGGTVYSEQCIHHQSQWQVTVCLPGTLYFFSEKLKVVHAAALLSPGGLCEANAHIYSVD